MLIFVLGLNHKTAPVEIREKIALSPNAIRQKAPQLSELKGISGQVIISTCNRTESYVSTEEPEAAAGALLSFWAGLSGLSREELRQYTYYKEGREAIRHLFRVSAGLDSMILGESQILGQVEDGYNLARNQELSNAVLNTLFQKAIYTGKRARTETLIDRQAVSIGSAAIELARRFFGTLEGRRVLVLGAGETGELVGRHLKSNGVQAVMVANRTFEKAEALARELGGTAIRFSAIKDHLPEADIVVGCTAAPHYVLKKEDVLAISGLRQGLPLLLVDIAVPRDMEPALGSLPGVTLYDVDDLTGVVQSNLELRRQEAGKVELIVNEEVKAFCQWLDTLAARPVIAALKAKADNIRNKEVQRFFYKLGGLTDREKKLVLSLVDSILNKLLSDPFINLKAYAPTEKGEIYCEAIRKLFCLDQLEESPDEDSPNKEGAL